MKTIRLNLSNRLILSFLFVGLIPILFLGYFLFNFYLTNTVQSIESNFSYTLKQSTNMIEDSIYSILDNETLDKQEKIESLKLLPYVDEVCDKKQAVKQGELWIKYEGDKNVYYIELDAGYIKKNLVSNENDELNIYLIAKEEKDVINSIKNEYNAEQYICIEHSIFNSEIYAIEFINKIAVLDKVYTVGEVAIRVSLIAVIIAICMSCVLSYKMSYGVNKLASEMKDLKYGNFDKEAVLVESTDEIELLSRTFKDMKSELNELVNKTFRLKISEREASIKALQSQISPHFLYNALDSINWNLLEKEDYETSEILVALSDMLRYSINDSKRIVKVYEEFEQIENYLKIQKERFGDRFDYFINLDDDVKNKSIPKMIVQPVVENSISHGLENHKNGILKISAKKEDNAVIIEVYDTGCGMNKQKLESLREQINIKTQIEDAEDFHIGLANVNARIKYIYGENSGLYIDSVEGEYTIVTIKIVEGEQVANTNS